MDGEPVLFDDLESGEPKKTSFDKRFDAYRDIAKEFGQPISMAGVMSAAEIEDAIWEWGQKGIKSKYFKRWFGDWELAQRVRELEKASFQESDVGIYKKKDGQSAHNTINRMGITALPVDKILQELFEEAKMEYRMLR